MISYENNNNAHVTSNAICTNKESLVWPLSQQTKKVIQYYPYFEVKDSSEDVGVFNISSRLPWPTLDLSGSINIVNVW